MLHVDETRLRRVRSRLDDLQYDTILQAMSPLYHQHPFPPFAYAAEAAALLPPGERAAFELLLLGRALPEVDAVTSLGEQMVTDLLELGILGCPEPGLLCSEGLALVSYLDRYLLVSANPLYPGAREPDMPIYIGPESLLLAQHLPLCAPGARVLDLCTGSGILGILAARTASRVVAADLSEVAVQAARCNVALNGLTDRVEVRQGDLFQPVAGLRFDLIVASAPYVPVPDGVHFPLFGAGGEDGLRVLGPLLDQAKEYLTESGRLVTYLVSLGDERAPSIAQLLDHLARRDGFAVDLLLRARIPRERLMVTWAATLAKVGNPGLGALPAWKRLFDRQDVRFAYQCLIRIRRGTPGVRTIALFA